LVTKDKSARHHSVSQKVWFISSPNVDKLLTFDHCYTQHKMRKRDYHTIYDSQRVSLHCVKY